MNISDLSRMHDLKPVLNSLPGESVPYYLASGEGLRYESGGQHWTVIARSSDTDGDFDAAYIQGARGTEVPFHELTDHQRSYYVFEGSVQVWLPGQSRILTQGDSVHVPPGTPIAYRMLSHLTRILMFSAPGGALDALARPELETERRIYAATPQSDELLLPSGLRVDDVDRVNARALDDIGEDLLPEGQEAYVIRAGEGDRRAWPDTINAYSARGANTGRQYFAVTTLASKQPYIIRHFHQQHTENFFCLTGRVWLWVNGEELLLTAGDFLYAPAGTIHSFAIAAHNTRMLGILTTDVFEPFFDVTGQETQDIVQTDGLIDPMSVPAAMQANPDLDVVVVDGPPERTRAIGI